VTLVRTNGWLPVLVIVYSTVTGRFHSICPKLCVSLFEEIRGWATAAKATVSRKNIDSKLRFMRYILFWCTNVAVLDEILIGLKGLLTVNAKRSPLINNYFTSTVIEAECEAYSGA
jgi:hypothetical protein